MIGLMVVTFVTVFAAGLKSSVAQVVDENFAGGLVIQNSDGFSPIPGGAAVAARKVPGVSAVATIRAEQAKLVAGGAGAQVSAPSRDIEKTVDIEWKKGGPAVLRRLRDDQAILSDSFASDHGLEVGDRFRLLSQTRRRPSFEVAGEFDSKLDVFGSVLITQAAMAREFGQTQDTIDFVETEPGADAGRGRRRSSPRASKTPSRSPKC